MSALCGTYPGYQRHLKAIARGDGDRPCVPCRQAAADYQRQRRHALAAAAGVEPKQQPARRRRPLPDPPPPPAAVARPALTAEQLDALCGGTPTVMLPCPRPGCARQVGPYYSAASPEARGALADHLHLAHAAVSVSAGAL